MGTKLNIYSFGLPSLFISEEIRLKLKDKNIWVNDRFPHENIFKQWVIDWLRVEKNIYIAIGWSSKKNIEGNNTWWYSVGKIGELNQFANSETYQQGYNSHEECQEAAILAALELV